MQLLRVPFNITYVPPEGQQSLSSLLQPPGLDVAWFRAEQRPTDFIIEPEVELRATLLALCLRAPK